MKCAAAAILVPTRTLWILHDSVNCTSLTLAVYLICSQDPFKLRLAHLTHAELIELAAEACHKDTALKAKAEVLIAAVAPTPNWIKDAVLLSPDLGPILIRCCMSTALYGQPLGAVAPVCRFWHGLRNLPAVVLLLLQPAMATEMRI